MARAAFRVAGPRGAGRRSSARTHPSDCDEVDTGGYRVTTTLDWDMQKTTEKWVYAAARAPHVEGSAHDPAASSKIPRARVGLDPRTCAAGTSTTPPSAVMDYRTGEVLAYVGSASYTAKGTKKFQPQFDVLADGWRQPGSSIKPIDYVIGIDDETMTASTMFMDVVTNFGRGFTPTQADKLERGPVRLRSALQFSLNIPAIKATIMQGLEHMFERTQDFGLRYPSDRDPGDRRWASARSRSTRSTCSAAYGTIANGGVRMPRQLITKVVDENGKQVWPLDDAKPEGTEVISPQAAYIITDILAGNTQPKVNPYWGEFAIYERRHAPAGRLQDRHDERQPRRARLRLSRPAARTRTRRPSRSASGWATATTRRTGAACRSTRRRRCGRRS